GGKAAASQLQQAGAPGVAVAMVFLTQKVAIRGMDTGPDQHRLFGLEDLVMRADADGGQVLRRVGRKGLGDSLAEDVVSRADGEGVVEQVSEQLADAAQGAVADKDQAEDQLPQPGPGDWQPEEQVLGGGRRIKGLL